MLNLSAQLEDKSIENPAFKMEENLEGRIRNLALAPSYDNTMIPLFEAISNATHAIQEKFGEEWVQKGEIRVYGHHDNDGIPVSFSVEDNGIGLTEENFRSFRTYDTSHKLQKGGKGVGRLTWLKVFDLVNVRSTYQDSGSKYEREFDFVLNNKNPFQKYSCKENRNLTDFRTTVFLQHLKAGYKAHCPRNPETVANKIIAHFLPYLIGERVLSIIIGGQERSFNINQIIHDNTYNPQSDEFEIENIGKFRIRHLLLNRSLVEKPEHTIYLSAHDRVVSPHIINNQTGLTSYFEYQGQMVAYVGIVSGSYLDSNVTQERNHFDIDKDKYKEITKAAEERAKIYLEAPIEEILEVKTVTVQRVISNFPRYKYLVKDSKDFVRRLPLGKKTEEEIYAEMSIYDYRELKSTNRQLQLILGPDKDPDTVEDFDQIFSKLIGRIGEQEKASLAEYITKRKAIIELLHTRLGYKDSEKKKRYTEEAVHKIICPLRVNSGQIEYGGHHLWLIDDRLAYYDFWASDEKIRKFAQGSDSDARPDLILFEGGNLLHREGTDQPVVIVEFKRPARAEYSDDENPIKQIYDYIRDLKENRIIDNNGALITSIGENRPFFCYLVCDITPRLKGILEDYDINKELPGGRGYFGYNKSRCAYIEVLQYDQIVKDARLRHEPFFKELGIN